MTGRGKRKQKTGSSRPVPPPVLVQQDETPEEQEEKFQRELAWCIEQLENGLSTEGSKPSSTQAQQGIKILKTLKNPKAPLVKKRQVMRNTFGDYRQKMEADAKKYGTNVKKMTFKSTSTSSSDKDQKYTFFKRSSQTTSGPDAVQDSNKESSASGFKFNFDVEGQNDSTKKPEADSCMESASITAVNYFKMEPSNENFCFNFDEPSELGT